MTGFPNMAGKPDIDDALAEELEVAGIHAGRYPFLKNGEREVDTSVRGDLHGWHFERAWYYWRCSGPGIEVAAAERLHAAHGKDVRVAGHCGCPSPTDWHNGLAVGGYHVDTPVGLKALADTIKWLVERAKNAVPSQAGDGLYLDRFEVRRILVEQPDENLDITEGILADIDALPIHTREDVTAPQAVEVAAIRAALVAAKCDSGDGTYIHSSMDQVVSALLAKFKIEVR